MFNRSKQSYGFYLMNVLIANSETEKTNKLIELLHQHDCNINILRNTSSVEETIQFYTRNSQVIDLSFFETQLTDGSSFDVPRHVVIKNPIVFTSSSKQDAYEAIKSNSLDFLLDPYELPQVAQAVNKAKNKIEFLNPAKKNYKKRFLIKFGDKIQFRNTDDVSYIYAEGKIAYIVTSSTNRKYIIEHTLDELEKKYLDPTVFYRINRKFIVNIDAIEEARNYVNSRLKLIINPATDVDMVVSREKVHDFKKWLNL